MKKIIILISSVLIFCVFIAGCSQEVTTQNVQPDIVQIRSICNLATLECYYHNVAKSTKEAGSWFQDDREFWIEYTGMAKVGIDMSKVTIEINNDVVTVFLPDAKLLSINILEETLNEDSYVMSEDGLIFKNKITADDQTSAINTAQKQMEDSVKSNSALLANAQGRAQTLIENYINNLGEISGVNYTIKWVYEDAAEDAEK